MPRRAPRHAIVVDSRQRLEFPQLLELVASYASSRPGKDAVAGIAPSSDLDHVTEQLAETEELRELHKESGLLRLDGLLDAPYLLASEGATAHRTLTPEELFDVYRLVDRARATASLVRDQERWPRLKARGERLEDLPELRQRLERSVDSGGAVLDSASKSWRICVWVSTAKSETSESGWIAAASRRYARSPARRCRLDS